MRFNNLVLRALFHFNMGALFLVLAWLGFMISTMYRAIPESDETSGTEIKLVPMSCECSAYPAATSATALETI